VRWLELSARVDAEAVEAVSEVFSRVAPGGVAIEPEIREVSDEAVVSGPSAVVRAYIPLDEQAGERQRVVAEGLWHLRAIWPVGDLEAREIAEDDWSAAWKRHYRTFRVGRRLVIRPSWLDDAPRPGDVVVTIDPGSAFGTGLHPTTRRCLALLEEVVHPGADVLDVGTGSGILALAAAALGARHIVATDIDPIAVETARANVRASGAEERIQVLAGSVEAVPPGELYDIVVANIIARVILELAPALRARLRPGGSLIAGGIIADRADEVAGRLTDLGLCLRRFTDGDWITLLGRWPGTS